MPTTYIYRRVSTEKQEDRGGGLAVQLDDCRKKEAEFSGTHVSCPEKFDDTCSGSVHPVDRPVMGKLYDIVQDGDIILAHRRDRVGRDQIGVGVFERALKNKGVRLVTCDEIATGDEGLSTLLKTILDAVSEYERYLIRGRIRRTLRNKRENGQVYCNRLYGFDKVDGELVPNTVEQYNIEQMRQMRAAGWSYTAVAQELTRRRVETPAGKTGAWRDATVRQILDRVNSVDLDRKNLSEDA